MKRRSLGNRIVATLFAGALMCSVLTGCGDTGESQAAGNEQTAQEGQNAENSGGQDSADTEGAGSDADSGELTTITILCKDRRYDNIPLADREEYQVWQKFKEMLAEQGIQLAFESVPTEQLETVVQTRLAAGNDLPDIIVAEYMDEQTLVALGEKGIIADVKAAIDQYSNGNTLSWWDKYWEVENLLTTKEGAIYWYPALSYKIGGEGYKGTGFCLQIRQDWLDKLSLEMPKTLEELYDVLVTFREQDANGNGVKDEQITVRLDSFQNGFAQSFGLANTLLQVDSSGKAVSPWLQPGIKDYILYMKSLVDAGLIDPGMMTDQVVEGKITENVGSVLYSYVTQNWYESMTGDEDALYAPLYPVFSDSYEPVFFRENAALVYHKYVVSGNTDKMEAIVRLFDTIYTEEYAELSYWGVEGESFEWSEDGTKRVRIELSDEEKEEGHITVGNALFGNVCLPVVNLQQDDPSPYACKNEFEEFVQTLDNEYEWSPRLAMSTSEETATYNKYITTLDTYSTELLVDLILGNRPIEDLDDAVEEMKAMGLDELLAVYQARSDRYRAQ